MDGHDAATGVVRRAFSRGARHERLELREPGNGYSLPVGADDGGGGEFAGDGASGAGPLDAFIQEGRVTVKFVTIGCAGPCASVKAVATGGHPRPPHPGT